MVGRSAKSVRPAQQEEIYTKWRTLQVEEATLFFQNLMNMRGIPASTCFRSDKTSITAPTLLDSCFTTDIKVFNTFSARLNMYVSSRFYRRTRF